MRYMDICRGEGTRTGPYLEDGKNLTFNDMSAFEFIYFSYIDANPKADWSLCKSEVLVLPREFYRAEEVLS